MIIPGIFEKDFEKAYAKIKTVEPLAEFAQIDIADGKLVNGKTFTNLKPLKDLSLKTKIEVHLMVKNPATFLKEKISAVHRVSAQVEGENIDAFIKKSKELGYETGLSLNPGTEIKVIEKYLPRIDYVQFMTVAPGGQGRSFEPQVLEKIEDFRVKNPRIRIQADGGINENNIRKVLKAGVNDVVIGSAIFDMKQPALSTSPIVGASRNALTINQNGKKIKRIAFLGGAAWKPEDKTFKDAYETAKLLALEGYSIINGGGPGVMRAATLGAHDAGTRALAITYHPNKPKRHYEGVDLENTFDDEIITLDYFDRTKVMLQTSDVHIVFKGSIGTLSELGMTWISSWIHEPNNKPIILFGDFWNNFLEAIRQSFLLKKGEDKLMKVCTTPEEVLDFIKQLS
jgi:ribulose-phosphate 3-epimerase